MYRIAYCDGDPIGDELFLRTLEQVLADMGRVCLIAHFSGAGALLAALARNPAAYDLLFLDIPRGDGETVNRLRQCAPRLPVVVLGGAPASGDKAAAQSRYGLSKPVSGEQLKAVMLSILQPSPPLLLRRPGSIQMVAPAQILFIEVFDHLLKIHTLSQQTLSAPGALSRLQREMPEGQFLRCHKSYLVNLAHVEGIRRYQILLSSGQRVPTSKKNYNQVRQSVLRYFSGLAQSGPAVQEIQSFLP